MCVSQRTKSAKISSKSRAIFDASTCTAYE